jgi:hypothetical protein
MIKISIVSLPVITGILVAGLMVSIIPYTTLASSVGSDSTSGASGSNNGQSSAGSGSQSNLGSGSASSAGNGSTTSAGGRVVICKFPDYDIIAISGGCSGTDSGKLR